MTEPTEFLDPSPKALKDQRVRSFATEYRTLFERCPVGKSFSLPLSVGKLASVRSTISRTFNVDGKSFKIVKHETCYEVYRKADTVEVTASAAAEFEKMED